MQAPDNTPKADDVDTVADNGATDTPPMSDLPADPAAALAALEAKHAEMADAYLRAKAESENIRRRADEEVAKARKYAVEAFAESLLPVKDSLEAAIAMPDAATPQVLEGVHATLRQLSAALERSRVLEIDPPAGTRFDPHQHQAISMVSAEQEANTVVSVLQKGYLIADRVLRPALVTVAAPK
jgi:molecular chaperone GrpE